MGVRPLETLLATEPLEIENGLSLVPRVKLNLTVFPSVASSSTKPIDEWKLKQALIDFLKSSLSVSITIVEDDLQIRRIKDVKKRKRSDSLAHGSLCIRDLGFLRSKRDEDEDVGKKLLEWRKYLVEKMDSIELNLQGDKYTLNVAIPESDDLEGMKTKWEEFNAFGNRGNYRGHRSEPDTIVLRGVPSRWFAEPRVSSKPSMLVTHTIFSIFGKIRNLSVAEDDQKSDGGDEDNGDIISGLHCKIVVQFEKHKDFFNALRVLCGRSLQKQGSRLKADYEVTWAKDGFSGNAGSQEKSSRIPIALRLEAPRQEHHDSQITSDDMRRKRFKVRKPCEQS